MPITLHNIVEFQMCKVMIKYGQQSSLTIGLFVSQILLMQSYHGSSTKFLVPLLLAKVPIIRGVVCSYVDTIQSKAEWYVNQTEV